MTSKFIKPAKAIDKYTALIEVSSIEKTHFILLKMMKRIKIRARGRADRIAKPMCHIEIKLGEKKQEEDNGSKG